MMELQRDGRHELTKQTKTGIHLSSILRECEVNA